MTCEGGKQGRQTSGGVSKSMRPVRPMSGWCKVVRPAKSEYGETS